MKSVNVNVTFDMVMFNTQTQTKTQKFMYSTLKIQNDFKNRRMQIIKAFWVRETSVKINKIIAGTDATL